MHRFLEGLPRIYQGTAVGKSHFQAGYCSSDRSKRRAETPATNLMRKGLHLPRKAIFVSPKTLTTEGGLSSQTVRLLLRPFTNIPQLPGLPYTTVPIS